MSYIQRIQHLIEMLNSNDPNERLVACKELRDARHPLSQEIIDALKSAAIDSNSDVANAAQQTLTFHVQMDDEKEYEHEEPITKLGKYWPIIGILIGIIPGSIFFLLTINGPGLTVINTICVGPAGVIGGIIGANIGRRSNKIAMVAFLISILGAFLGLVVAALTCFSCQ